VCQGSRSWATLKKCGPRALLSRLSASSGEPGCSQGKKRAFKPDSKLTHNNNRFKLLLTLPSIMHLRLAVLTIEGSKECTRGSLLLP
jgi:hypothetical protein